jgi:predicted extracellular nuclease
VLVGLAVAATSLVATPLTASANPTGTGLVISEVYGGGGNSGAQYTHDFIELYNPTAAAISVAGMSVQYRSSTGTSAQVTPLTGAVPARGHYLVQQAPGAGGTVALPTPDATGSIPMSGSAGVVLLVPTTAPFTTQGNLAGNPGLLDAVGYGTTATSFEETNTGVNLTNTTAAARSSVGADTDKNAPDFIEGAPDPKNSGSGPVEPPAGPVSRTIAEIQGTGATSPESGNTVITRGVVTARYETGGYNGFVIQTAGATPGAASHALFVYGGSGAAGAARAGLVSIGDHVQVTGRVSEFGGLTQITPGADSDIVELAETVPAIEPAVVAFPEDNAARERLEHMLLAPTGPFTVSDNYNLNRFGEMVLAAGSAPLRQPTDVAPLGSDEAAAVATRNAAERVVLDDGSTNDYTSSDPARDALKDIPLPYLTDDPTIQVGNAVTFTEPVILSYGFNEWRFQPRTQVTGRDGDSPVTFTGDTRTAAPKPVGGDLQVASFNVLNYFTTTGEEWVTAGNGTCSYYTDRDGDPVTNDRCNPDGPRGAAEQEDLERQQAKIVAAINALGAEVVSLEEIENSAQFGPDRDRAMADLVAALNADLGSETWSYVPSPTVVPDPDREDVIRTGFIYQRSAVKAQGESFIYDGPEFDQARDPLAQVFKPVGGTSRDKFLLIVNHFKSKGSAPSAPNPDADYGQGGFNAMRVTQAEALVDWAEQLKVQTSVEKVFLDGDFNSYTFEDPMQVLYDAGYASLEQEFDTGSTYVFGGMVGSLDHGLANAAALGSTTGADVWQINAVESVAHEYSRFNYNITQFYEPTPYRSSDHNPLVFGIDVR